MARFTATFAANLRAYTTVEVEAADQDAAHERFKEMAAEFGTSWPRWPGWADEQDIVFNPEYDTLRDYEYLEDPTEEPRDDT